MKHCLACNGLGFILASSNPHVENLEIQKCDACDKYADDNRATQACYMSAVHYQGIKGAQA